ncbi:hypothetical protein SAMN02745132_03449 [Enterovibrio nigricans DSM 22720]|uniref:Uncharacterized protein n=1 Tax=Enterovibrio nigricans DSM 22720 TaxID=1121868 RepID=A0A1T4V8H6_9GAMM|nr:hypothetical protein SAMN02745132_03449 [Enterovibrio nigricans DSM 22720]
MPHIPNPKKFAHILRSTINPQDANSGVMGTESSIAGRVQALKIGSLMMFSKKAFNDERF